VRASVALFKALGDLLVLLSNVQHCQLRLGIRDLIGHGARFIGPRAPMLRIVCDCASHLGPHHNPAPI
jgi:hypothetical protein